MMVDIDVGGPRPRPPRAVIVSSSFAPSLGGVEELVRCLGFGLTGLGAAPLVVTNRWPRELPERSTIEGISVLRVKFRFPSRGITRVAMFAAGFPRAIVSMIREIQRTDAEVVHVQCVSSNALYALIASRLTRRPLVVTLQGELTMDADRVYETDPVLRRLLRHLLTHADHVTACSRATLDEAHAFLGRSGAPSTVVYNGVRLEEFEGVSPAVIPRPYVFALGRHVHEKGFDVLLDAFAASGLADSFDLVIAGDGPEHMNLIAQADALGLADAVRFVGRTDRSATTGFFVGCEFFVLPSRHEPFGIVNVEAMAAGKAVIATRCGGVPEVVQDGVTGLLVNPGDPEELATEMKRLAAEPELTSRLGSAGRVRAEAFGWQHITDQYVEVYRSVISRRSAPGGRRVLRRRSGHTR